MSAWRLALLGGDPAFEQPVVVGRPNIGDRRRFTALVDDVLDRRWLTNSGPLVEELERRLADRLGVPHCVVVSNATTGLELTYAEAGLSGEVIVPAFTYIATVHALVRAQCRPVFCDIDPRTHCLDPNRVEDLITPNTTGIVGVHLWSRPGDVAALEQIAAYHGLHLILDAAHAFGSTAGERPIGTCGRASVFSFHATKVFNTFEGGAITTTDRHLAGQLRLARNFGFTSVEEVSRVGTNAKLPEVSAAMGLVNLEAVDRFIAVNRQNYQAYCRHLDGLTGITLLPFDDRDHPNYQYVVLEVDPAAAGLTRDDLLAVLLAERVLARRYFWPGVHRQAPYRTWDPDADKHLPHTERLAARVLVLPTGTAVTEADIATIAALLRTALAAPDAVRAARPEASHAPAPTPAP